MGKDDLARGLVAVSGKDCWFGMRFWEFMLPGWNELARVVGPFSNLTGNARPSFLGDSVGCILSGTCTGCLVGAIGRYS